VHYYYRPPASTRARSALTSSPARRTASSISLPLTGAPRDSSASTAASSRAASRTTSTAHPPQSTETARGIARIGARASNNASDAAFSAHRCAAVWSSAITRQKTVVTRRGHAAASSAAPSDACNASSTAFSAALRSLTDDRAASCARISRPPRPGSCDAARSVRCVGPSTVATTSVAPSRQRQEPCASSVQPCSKSTPSLLSSLSSSSMVQRWRARSDARLRRALCTIPYATRMQVISACTDL
ncbi:unnamed protein product, partial [Pelagomonas calceolata]